MKNILLLSAFLLMFCFSKSQVVNLSVENALLNLDEANFPGLGQQPYAYLDESPYYKATTIFVKEVFEPIQTQLSSSAQNNREVFIALLVKKNGKPDKVFYKLSGDYSHQDKSLIEASFQNIFNSISFGDPLRPYNLAQKIQLN